MKKLILVLILLSTIFLVSAQTDFNKYYQLDLDYNNGEISLINHEIYFSDTEVDNYFGFYSAIVNDAENNSLDVVLFDVPNKILYDEVDENGTIVSGGEAELEDVDFTIYVPYYENASLIKIYNESLTEEFVVSVFEYSKEISLASGQNEEEKQITNGQDKNKEKVQKDVSEEKTFSEKVLKYWWILVVILAILVIVLIKKISKKE